MVSGTPRQGAADLDLLRAVFARRDGAWARFVQHCQSDVYTACRLAFPGAEANDIFGDVMEQLRADDFALLRPFDGRAPLAGFLRLVLRDVLCQRVARLLIDAPARGWRAFEHFFKRDIARIIAGNFPDAAESGRSEDLYHDVVAKLIEDDYRRILAYDGKGSFGGFVLRVVGNLCIDLLRRDVPRRRLPAAIQRLPEAQQEAFRQLYWENCPPERLDPAAVAAVKAVLPRNFSTGDEDGRPRLVALSTDGPESHTEVPDERPTPEGYAMVQQEGDAWAKAMAALRAAIPGLPPDIRLYLQYVMSTEPEPAPREIARLMARPVAEIYRLKQQAERLLRQILSDDEAVKNLRMSV